LTEARSITEADEKLAQAQRPTGARFGAFWSTKLAEFTLADGHEGMNDRSARI